MDVRVTPAIGAGLVLLTLLAYRPLETAGFVYEDNNPLTSIDPSIPNDNRGPWTDWTTERMTFTLAPRALSNVTMRVQGWARATARGYHLFNLALHLENGVLLWILGEAVAGPVAGVITMGAFLLHPINSEAVSYVSARPDLLYAGFILLMLVSAEHDQRWAVCLAGVGAVWSKETAITVIGFLPLWLWLRGRSFSRWIPVLIAWGLGGIVVAYRLLHVSAHQGSLHPWGAIWLYTSAPGYGPIEVAGMQIAACWRLLALVFVPIGFSIDHDFDVIPVELAADAMVLTVILLIALWWRRAAHPWAWFAAAWMLIGLAPRLLIPLPEYLHEQHLYVLLIGPWLAIGAALPRAADRVAVAWRRHARLWTQGVKHCG